MGQMMHKRQPFLVLNAGELHEVRVMGYVGPFASSEDASLAAGQLEDECPGLVACVGWISDERLPDDESLAAKLSKARDWASRTRAMIREELEAEGETQAVLAHRQVGKAAKARTDARTQS